MGTSPDLVKSGAQWRSLDVQHAAIRIGVLIERSASAPQWCARFTGDPSRGAPLGLLAAWTKQRAGLGRVATATCCFGPSLVGLVVLIFLAFTSLFPVIVTSSLQRPDDSVTYVVRDHHLTLWSSARLRMAGQHIEVLRLDVHRHALPRVVGGSGLWNTLAHALRPPGLDWPDFGNLLAALRYWKPYSLARIGP